MRSEGEVGSLWPMQANSSRVIGAEVTIQTAR